MIGNSLLPGIATQPVHRVRAMSAEIVAGADEAMHWAADACVPGEYWETLLPELMWAIDKATDQLVLVEVLEQRLAVTS